MAGKHINADGLTLEQRKLLTELAAGKSLNDACQELDVPRGRFMRWLQTDEKFRAHYDDLFNPENLKEIQKVLNASASRAVEVYEDAIDQANRSMHLDLECPHCQKSFKKTIQVEDWKSRLAAADTLLRVSGILRERRDLKVTLQTAAIDWSRIETSDLVNVLAWRTGRPLAPAAEERLRQLGVITEEQRRMLPSPEIVDAEFREVDSA